MSVAVINVLSSVVVLLAKVSDFSGQLATALDCTALHCMLAP